MDAVEAALAAYPWGIYLCLLLAPFIQEDAAIIGAASASTIGMGIRFCCFSQSLLASAPVIYGNTGQDGRRAPIAGLKNLLKKTVCRRQRIKF